MKTKSKITMASDIFIILLGIVCLVAGIVFSNGAMLFVACLLIVSSIIHICKSRNKVKIDNG